MKSTHGFTLIELIVFIVIVSILGAGLFLAFDRVVSGGAMPEESTRATLLAEQRLELILGQRQSQGFTSFTDPCLGGSPAAECTLPTGYAVTGPTIVIDPDPTIKTITVEVIGPSRAELTAMVRDF